MSQTLRAFRPGHIFLLFLSLGFSSIAATLPPNFTEQQLGGTWNEAVGLTFASDNRMYVWERGGRVWIVENGVKSAQPFLDISDEVGGWRDYGLLGFALHPDFYNNGYVYLLYVVDHYHLTHAGQPGYDPAANEYFQATIGRITRYKANASDGYRTIDPSSRLVLLGESISTGFPILHQSHGVGTILFGTDGSLLASCGDGASYSSTDIGSASETYYAQGISEGIIRSAENVGALRSQMLSSLSGKIVRLDPANGNGLPSNPWYDPANPRSAKSRVWALGLRNPCRMILRPGTGSHDRNVGDPGVLYIGDVGYNTWEDLNVCTRPGMNFGWPIFEGLDIQSAYYNSNVGNPDAPNPLYGQGGCAQPYFYFRDLTKQDTLAAPSWPNPCNTAVQIPATIPRFLHSRPAIDWKHGTGPSRTGIYSGTTATTINIGAAGSPVSGPQFPGNCSIGGVWYTGSDFPATYANTYFHADYGEGWIKNFIFDANNKPTAVRDFLSTGGGVVFVTSSPIDGALYYISWSTTIRKITYVPSGNQPPTAVASLNKNFGPGPLTVQLTGSNSKDPENLPLSYSWNFGDGSALSTAANPSHTFNAPAGVPTRFDVKLKVTDSGGLTSEATLIVSVNNTPPVVSIVAPVDGTLYPLSGDTLFDCTAIISDAEQSAAQLSCAWQTILHHNDHIHSEAIVNSCATTTTISPVGCDGQTYYYSLILTVTDAAGLTTTTETRLFPDCNDHPPTITTIVDQTVSEDNSTGPLGFTVFDAETAATSLTVTAVSSNPALIPNSSLILSGAGGSRSLTVIPSANQSGSATITLTVNDGVNNASTSFNLTVLPVNDPPVISNIADRSIVQDSSTGPIAFTVGDIESPAGNLLVWASSSNQQLVPDNNITFGGSGASRTVTVTPAASQNGTALITVYVGDALATTTDTFQLTVTAPPPPFLGAKINFQPLTAPIPTGYLPDGGQVYGNRNGLTYGWSADKTGSVFDRNSSLSPDQRYDTFCRMQQGGNNSARWEIAVPNGNYDVSIVAGDTADTKSSYAIDAEGVQVVKGQPTSANRWVSGRRTVSVADGRLTITSGSGSKNNEICFIDIVKVP
jgi:glucose/arabinose dehydrogenase